MTSEFDAFLLRLGLGKQIAAAVPISGGLMHRMYRVQTNKGIFALKMLNREVMKRPEAERNMASSEMIAHALEKKVPLVAAIEREGRHVHFFEEQFYMVYPWLEGRSIFSPEIREVHCAKMGEILAKIHDAAITVDVMEEEACMRTEKDWESVFLLCGKEAWAEELKTLFPEIMHWHEQGYLAAEKLSAHQLISHRDLDPKNVMWQGMEPVLIDWEAAGYINPWQEVAECLFYWTDDGKGHIQKSRFQAFLTAYGERRPLDGAPWEAALDSGYLGLIDWLYYNAGRAAGLEDESETELGRQQVLATLQTLKNREKANEQMLSWLTRCI